MNYKRIIEDFDNGVLDKNTIQVTVDNDCIYWTVDTGDEDKDEDIQIALKDKYGCGGGYHDIVDILVAAGVNAEWC